MTWIREASDPVATHPSEPKHSAIALDQSGRRLAFGLQALSRRSSVANRPMPQRHEFGNPSSARMAFESLGEPTREVHGQHPRPRRTIAT